MMTSTTLKLCIASVVAAAALAACGGSPQSPVDIFLNSFGANLNTPQAQNTPTFFGLFDTAFADDGYTKAALLANVQADSTAITSGAIEAGSAFPQITASNSSVTGCDGNNLCTLNTTLSTSGPDATTVTTKISVRIADGVVTIVGNGVAAQPI